MSVESADASRKTHKIFLLSDAALSARAMVGLS
jgi:hypothetical protein